MTTTLKRQDASEARTELLQHLARNVHSFVQSEKEPRHKTVSWTFKATPKSQAPQWLDPTTKAINNLSWDESNLPDGASPPNPKAGADLLCLLITVLEDNTPAPNGVIPTWRGGVAAEWHTGGFSLEIECDPDGTADYLFARPDAEEYEGPLDPENHETLMRFKEHLALLPK